MQVGQFTLIEGERVKVLNDKQVRGGDFVVYWMQATQRAEHNQALEYAIGKANRLDKPLIVYFGITNKYPEANLRHYQFMLEGLREMKQGLAERNLRFVVQNVSPELGISELAKHASIVVVDRGYTKIEKQWRSYVASHILCPLVQLECNVVVPVEVASPKEEYSAATFRPKIKKQVTRYLVLSEEKSPAIRGIKIDVPSFEIDDIGKAVSELDIDKNVDKVKAFRGGTFEAKQHLTQFIETKLDKYADQKNDPTKKVLSNLSPYLHFGQISPVYVALKVLETNSPSMDTYLEELVVRRELAFNFVFYNQNYDSFDGLAEWTKKSLNEHRKDSREQVYSLDDFENAKTHDPYWNAAQNEMNFTGKMHGYMRMYWGKKIIEWTKTPQEAYKYALYLNNKYELDGRDPNGYAGVAWCFGKHDRPWKERSIFGKIRYMNAKGLRRKFDVEKYVKQVNQLSK